MKADKREIVTFVIAALATLVAVWFFLEKMKKDWQGSSESYQDAYEEVIIMNCRKRKLPGAMKKYETRERIICIN